MQKHLYRFAFCQKLNRYLQVPFVTSKLAKLWSKPSSVSSDSSWCFPSFHVSKLCSRSQHYESLCLLLGNTAARKDTEHSSHFKLNPDYFYCRVEAHSLTSIYMKSGETCSSIIYNSDKNRKRHCLLAGSWPWHRLVYFDQSKSWLSLVNFRLTFCHHWYRSQF